MRIRSLLILLAILVLAIAVAAAHRTGRGGMLGHLISAINGHAGHGR